MVQQGPIGAITAAVATPATVMALYFLFYVLVYLPWLVPPGGTLHTRTSSPAPRSRSPTGTPGRAEPPASVRAERGTSSRLTGLSCCSRRPPAGSFASSTLAGAMLV